MLNEMSEDEIAELVSSQGKFLSATTMVEMVDDNK